MWRPGPAWRDSKHLTLWTSGAHVHRWGWVSSGTDDLETVYKKLPELNTCLP